MTVDFHLTEIQHGDSGPYACEYSNKASPDATSQPSDDLLLLVTGPLPKPSLSAWPSSVVPPGSNVTLKCKSPIPGVSFVLRKKGCVLDPMLPYYVVERKAVFYLTDIQHSNSGHYTCEYSNKASPNVTSQPSDDLLLLVTGALSQPSLQAYQWGKVAPGGNMTLQCQTEDILTKHKVFLLLKEGTLSPTQPKILENDRAEFTLHNVTVSDSGYYSCVYHQAEAPFWASYPSNDLQILVTELWLLDEVEITKPPQIKEGSGSSGIVIVVVSIVIFLLLLSAILIYKYSQRGKLEEEKAKPLGN
nr:T-cell-interacting, activating receptor on myeloid cells protein 1-like [Castor canadensis]